MKSLFTLFLGITISASAYAGSYNYNDYVLFGGGFGFDTLIDRSVPYADSYQTAQAVFTAMDATSLISHKKAAGVSTGDDVLGLTCGGSECGIYTLLHKNDIGQVASDQTYTVRFPSVISQSLYSVLTGATQTVRIGATTRSIKNIVCQSVVSNMQHYSCSITGIYAMMPPFPLQMMVDQQPDEASRVQFRQLMDQALRSIGY